MMRRFTQLRLIVGTLLPSALAIGASGPPRPITAPDGRGVPGTAKAPAHPSLEEQLRTKKQRDSTEQLKLPQRDSLEPATQTEDLLELGSTAGESKLKAALSDLVDARFRMSLGLALAQALGGSSKIKVWSIEPGMHLSASWRLDGEKSSSYLWLGFRLASWAGNAQSTTSLARFAWTYIGPLIAWDYRSLGDGEEIPPNTWHLRLAGGIAGRSSQVDRDFPGDTADFATQGMKLDGSGLWFESSLSWPLADRLEFETRLGAQHGALVTLTYASLGVNLWND